MFTSPSPFVATSRIYGDPSLSKSRANTSALSMKPMPPTSNGRSNGTLPPSSPQSPSSQEVLDFSVKKARHESYTNKSLPNKNSLNRNVTLDSECLDLSVKPQSQNNKNIFHNLSEIPPPNAMNQLGLRLTSEVTLFPSQHATHLHHQQQLLHQQQQHQRHPSPSPNKPSSKRDRERDRELHNLSRNGLQFSIPTSHHNNVLSLNSNHLRQLQTQPKWNSSSSPSYSHPPPPNPTKYASSSTNPKLSSNSTGSTSHSNPHVWRPAASTTPAASSAPNSHPSPRPKDSMTQPHGNHLSKRKPSPSQQATLDRLPLPGHVRGTAAKPTPTMSLNSQRQQHQQVPSQHHSLAPQHEKDTPGIPPMSFEQLAQFGNFMMPPVPPSSACYPNIDPAYLSLFASPFQLPPSVLMRLPPGTMEGLQYYMQQGMPPQFHPNWPNTTGKDSRGGGHHK